MKCHILFSGKNKKNIISLSSAENAQRVVKVNLFSMTRVNILNRSIGTYNIGLDQMLQCGIRSESPMFVTHPTVFRHINR